MNFIFTYYVTVSPGHFSDSHIAFLFAHCIPHFVLCFVVCVDFAGNRMNLLESTRICSSIASANSCGPRQQAIERENGRERVKRIVYLRYLTHNVVGTFGRLLAMPGAGYECPLAKS